jgi:hypothetical protein
MGDLHLDTRLRAGVVEIAVFGPLTSRTAPQVRTALSPYRSKVNQVRLRNCTDIDLDGLFGLLAADIEAGEAGGAIRLRDVPPLIERYLHQHHASHLLEAPPPPQE